MCVCVAGSSGSTALSFYKIPINYVNSIIDSDPNKWGMEYLILLIPIISLEKAKDNCPDLIIIASMYSLTIQKTIKDMGFKSSVLSIYQNISFKDNKLLKESLIEPLLQLLYFQKCI